MSNWKGSTTIAWTVERLIDTVNRKLIPLPGGVSDADENYVWANVDVEVRGYFAAGRYSGPPENCYPDEGEIEILSATDESGFDWLPHLTTKETEALEKMAWDELPKSIDDDYDPPDYDDCGYDRDIYD